jgi:hypothetical protein
MQEYVLQCIGGALGHKAGTVSMWPKISDFRNQMQTNLSVSTLTHLESA